MTKDVSMATKAKMDNLAALRRLAMEMIHTHNAMDADSNHDGTEASPDVQKVVVAAPDRAGLAQGLDKAQDILGSDAEEEMNEPEESLLDDSDAGEDRPMPGQMRDNQSVADMLNKMRKGAAKKKY